MGMAKMVALFDLHDAPELRVGVAEEDTFRSRLKGWVLAHAFKGEEIVVSGMPAMVKMARRTRFPRLCSAVESSKKARILLHTFS